MTGTRKVCTSQHDANTQLMSSNRRNCTCRNKDQGDGTGAASGRVAACGTGTRRITNQPTSGNSPNTQ